MKVTRPEPSTEGVTVILDQAVCVLEYVYGHTGGACVVDRCGVCVLLRFVREHGYEVKQEQYKDEPQD